MPNVYQARILRTGDPALGAEVVTSTSVYADSLIEARQLAAAELGVEADRIEVAQIPDVYNPTMEEIRKEVTEGVFYDDGTQP